MSDNALGNWIRKCRKELGFSQTELADFAGTSQAKISQWETGKDRPADEVLVQLEALFEEKAPAAKAKSQASGSSSKTPPSIDDLRAQAKPKANKKAKAGVDTTDYRYDGQKRLNIPTSKIAAEGTVPKVPNARYAYNPHLPPVLRYDPSGKADRVQSLITDAGQRPLTAAEQSELREVVSHYDPWLEWTGKREQHEHGFFEIDPVALHIHERVSTQAIVRTAMRKDVQRNLFADPEQPYHEAVQFYHHDVDWANRLILGDSLQVMSSLLRREGMAGKVQMIYMDPPYGIKFGSNFQPIVGKREVKDKEIDLTRESEMVQAFRDTWHLGVHSYLTYLRERMILARDLLSDSGSLFVQISDDHLHRVRSLLDEVFGAANFCSVIGVRKTAGASSPYAKTNVIASVSDYLLWYAKDFNLVKYRQLFRHKPRNEFGATGMYQWVMDSISGERRRIRSSETESEKLHLYTIDNLTATGFIRTCTFDYSFRGRAFSLPSRLHWKTNLAGMDRLKKAERIETSGASLRYVRFFDDFDVYPLNNVWEDTASGGFTDEKVYAVQTNSKVVARCMLMATDPGDLVVDPTCGSGTTAYIAEQWGRRWITIDTSRVALAIARQRLLTAKFEHYRTRDGGSDFHENPSTGFIYKSVPHITLKSISQNSNLDPIFEKHDPLLDECLEACNSALDEVADDLRTRLVVKLQGKQKAEGKRGIADIDRRRWKLPRAGERWEHWEVPYDTDFDWPVALQDAVNAYRSAWRIRMGEANACIAANVDQQELVDQPEVVKGVLRVSGPFTAEGVRPEELKLGEEGLFDGTPNIFDGGAEEIAETDLRNQGAYLARMVQLLRADGVTFPDNQHQNFGRIEPLFESTDSGGSLIHAEGLWEGEDEAEPNHIGVGFGPQYGPVAALQVEELIRASRRYDELVIAGFSFDAAASAVIEESSHPRLRIHQAYIRPDVNPAMDGLLKDTPDSQLFTVFGQPDIKVEPKGNDWVCELLGVDIYDPLTSTVRSSGASKVAAWFLDQDYDGRCFCITQAFFPDQKAWDKIAKALGSSADPEAFAAFKGTVSLPFPAGKHRRIAVKVIDPRGNEVMAIRRLET